MDFIFDTFAWFVQAPFNLVIWIVGALIAGGVARQLTNDRSSGCFSNMILGFVGAIIGGFLAGIFVSNSFPDGGLPLIVANFIMAVIGAALLIYIKRAIVGRR